MWIYDVHDILIADILTGAWSLGESSISWLLVILRLSNGSNPFIVFRLRAGFFGLRSRSLVLGNLLNLWNLFFILSLEVLFSLNLSQFDVLHVIGGRLDLDRLDDSFLNWRLLQVVLDFFLEVLHDLLLGQGLWLVDSQLLFLSSLNVSVTQGPLGHQAWSNCYLRLRGIIFDRNKVVGLRRF